jgi:hypothetical protein
VPFYGLLKGGAFGPRDIEIMSGAFEAALRELRLDRADPTTRLVAKRIIEPAQQGAVRGL